MPEKEIYELHPLFEEVQLNRVFPDGKTFVDCTPRFDPAEISKDYLKEKAAQDFNLKRFVLSHFLLPVPHSHNYQSDTSLSIEDNIERLWPALTRQPGEETGSVIPLPYPYIVPGGRFGEIYYWDSYFTMLGLAAGGHVGMVENMVNNFTYLIEKLGYIPNGNRSYFLGRSQPPFYSLMAELLASIKGEAVLSGYLPWLEKEHDYWMKGATELQEGAGAAFHVVRMPDGNILNRYWDEKDTARPESYAADIELAATSDQEKSRLFRHLRAGAESGWDYSCRWFRNEESFASIHTADIVPVDLNGLIYKLEMLIAQAHQINGNDSAAAHFRSAAEKRKTAVNRYCWNKEKGFYFDYDARHGEQKSTWTIAGASPLFFGLAPADYLPRIESNIREKFLCPGGVVTSLKITGQQWDAPNGWAPLQWITIMGLEKYGSSELAKVIAQRWMQLNADVFRRTGKLMEKYNVVDTRLDAGGGEYEGQDGFGWTNGVYLALGKHFGSLTAPQVS